MFRLHITNGDSTVELLKASNVEGDILPWRDILHMGPVPSGHSLEQLSIVRASFLASLNWGDKDNLLSDFQQRDNVLKRAIDYEQIIFWFEHDLYDQLQLLQLFDWFNQRKELLPKLMLINPDKHLGYHEIEDVPKLFAQQKPVTQTQLTLATNVWRAYTQPTPEQLSGCIQNDLSALPHLRNALLRTLAELPAPDTGLNQTETAVFKILSNHESGMTKIEIFRKYNEQESAAFHGDTSFSWYIDQLLKDAPELVIFSNNKFMLTNQGRDCLNQPIFWKRKYHEQQWLGGYALGLNRHYYWHNEKQQLT